MNEFTDKLIAKLEQESKVVTTPIIEIECLKLSDAIDAVKSVAEEYKECTLCYLGSPCEYQNADVKYVPLTNSDRLRTMSDEELTDFLFGKFAEWNNKCDRDPFDDVIFTRKERFMQWLRAEAKGKQ